MTKESWEGLEKDLFHTFSVNLTPDQRNVIWPIIKESVSNLLSKAKAEAEDGITNHFLHGAFGKRIRAEEIQRIRKILNDYIDNYEKSTSLEVRMAKDILSKLTEEREV